MTTVSIHEAKTHLSRHLREVEEGATVVIARGREPIAKLVPFSGPGERPKVGEIEGPVFRFPAEAFLPLSDDELREWGV